MPTYSFIDTNSGEVFELFMKISEREIFLKENTHIQPIIDAPAIVGGVSIKDKVPAGFKEVLAKVAESHKGSVVAQRHGRSSIKEVQTKRVVDNLYKKRIGK